MKLMFASDIHGSAYYAELVRDVFLKEAPDKLVLLGDLLYHGPRNDLPREYEPKKVIPILNSMKERILCVRGNCDTEVDQMVLEFPIMADYAAMFDSGLTMYITHGHHLDMLSLMNRGDILIHGHTHVQAMERQGRIYYINPGSTSIPKEGNRPSYMMYEKGTFVIYDLETGGEISRLAIGAAD